MGLTVDKQRIVLYGVQECMGILPHCSDPAQCFLDEAWEGKLVGQTPLRLRLRVAKFFPSLWSCSLRCIDPTLTC